MSEKRFEYDGAAWDSRFREEGWGEGKHPESRLLKFIEDYKNEIGPKILDLGSGEGRHLIPLAKKGYEVTGLEFTDGGIRKTEEKKKDQSVKANLVRGDFRELPFENQTFDTIISTSTLQHNNWEGMQMAFAEAARVLKSGGLFFVRMRSDKAIVRKRGAIVEDKGRTWQEFDKHGNLEIHHDTTLDELKELAEKSGLEIEGEPIDEKKVEEDGKVIPGHWNVVFRKKQNENQ